jgi:hypothetical protein
MDDLIEKWRPINGWPYEVSSFGRVRNACGTLMKPSAHPHGYQIAWFRNKGRRGREYVHRLVARAFLGAPPTDDAHADHIDRDRTNNNLANIRWLTPQANRASRKFATGESHYAVKLSTETVKVIRADKVSTNVALARQFGVRRETVRDIRLGKERRYDI